MNPNYNEQPDLSLPQPHLPGSAQIEQSPAPLSPEASSAALQMPSLTSPVHAMPVSTGPPIEPHAGTQTATTLVAAPSAADDTDLIEKEWVEKAKAIVASTKDDPFAQSREISRFKADYINKRYDKNIKLPEA